MCNTDQCGREIILRSISQFENSVWNSGAISNTKELDRSWIDPFPKSQYSKPNTNVILYVSSSGNTILLCIGFPYHILGFKQHSEQDRSKIDPFKKSSFLDPRRSILNKVFVEKEYYCITGSFRLQILTFRVFLEKKRSSYLFRRSRIVSSSGVFLLERAREVLHAQSFFSTSLRRISSRDHFTSPQEPL